MKKITNQDKMYIDTLQTEILYYLVVLFDEKGSLSSVDYSHLIVSLLDEYKKFKDFTLPFLTTMSATERKNYNKFIKCGDKIVNHYADKLISDLEEEKLLWE